MDRQYEKLSYSLNLRPHRYGDRVYLISDPYLLTRLAHLCSPECVQPEINGILRELYQALGRDVANREFPRARREIPTRMAAQHREAIYAGETIAPDTSVVLVDLARAGILPAAALFDMYTPLLGVRARTDHIFINRATDENKRVSGAPIYATKIGGPVEGALVILPDPMGATGNSMSNVIHHYKSEVPGRPLRWISLNLIVTPEYIRKLKSDHPEVVIYALRLDRGFSSARALESLPGEHWDEERGLNDRHYIVPGGGGFGELANNAFV